MIINRRFTIGLFLGGLLISLLSMIALSPYGRNDKYKQKLVEVSVNINAKPSEVFTYLGNSNNAKDWSTFVDHIIPLNSEEKKDGEIGSLRRCFNQKDELGKTWDEEILLVEKNRYRQLSCYNFKNFNISANNLRTEQHYKALENGTTLLVFTLFYTPEKASYLDELKMYYSAFKVASIFEGNLKNIKYFIEKDKKLSL